VSTIELRLAFAIALIASAPARADSGDPDGYLAKLAAKVAQRLDELAAARAPKLVPPRPVAVKWGMAKLGSFDLGAPVVAVAAGDLDGDKKGELYVVTAREVVAFTLRGARLAELGRAAFAGDLAVPAPRHPVGTAMIEGTTLVAAASPWARELRVTLAKRALVATPGETGMLRCPGKRAQLVPGRNSFDDGSYALRCRDAVDAAGIPLRVTAQLAATGNKLAVDVQRCAAGAPCQPAGSYSYSNVGLAYDIADLDGDGTPEVITASAAAPGDADTLKVHKVAADKKLIYSHEFNIGVAGIAAVDLDGNGTLELIAVARHAGATVIDVWRMNG